MKKIQVAQYRKTQRENNFAPLLFCRPRKCMENSNGGPFDICKYSLGFRIKDSRKVTFHIGNCHLTKNLSIARIVHVLRRWAPMIGGSMLFLHLQKNSQKIFENYFYNLSRRFSPKRLNYSSAFFQNHRTDRDFIGTFQ